MAWLHARKTAFLVLACVPSACAMLDGLDRYDVCGIDCDASVSVAGNVRDGAIQADASSSPQIDAGSGRDDVVSDAPSADVGSSRDVVEASDASVGDTGVSDASEAGPPLCVLPSRDDGGPLAPLVYYPFEGDTTDHSGNGNNGVATRGVDVTYSAGKLGEGIAIVSGGQGVGVTGTTSLMGGKTLCAWVNPSSATTGLGLPIFVGGSNFYDVEAATNPVAGSCTVTESTLFMDNGACSATTLAAPPGSWSFVCFAYDVVSTTFFSNGSSQAVTGAQYDPYTLSSITIGSNRIGGSTTARLFVGQIDEVSIWSVALSGAAMSALYDGGAGCRLP